jgi:D-serine deaminase-like pyridoxal phosphate-dependent protein
MATANQEHGIVARRDGTVDPRIRQYFPIGTQLRILPNHACATAAQFVHLHVIGPDSAVTTWSRFNGW